jgi:hypothetical protein
MSEANQDAFKTVAGAAFQKAVVWDKETTYAGITANLERAYKHLLEGGCDLEADKTYQDAFAVSKNVFNALRNLAAKTSSALDEDSKRILENLDRALENLERDGRKNRDGARKAGAEARFYGMMC